MPEENNNEVKEEKVVEEKIETTEEASKENIVKEEPKEEKIEDIKVSDGFIDAIEVKDGKEVEDKVNEARVNFSNVHKAEMKKNRIIGIVFMVVMVGAVALSYAFPKYITYMFIAIIAFFVGTLVITKVSRSKMDVAVGDYLNVYGSESDSYVYKNDEIKDVKMAFRNKPDENVIRSLDFKENVFHIGSRDVIKGTMNNINFKAADASIKTGDPKDKKTHKTIFVGKVLEFETKIEDEGRVFLYLKGCGDAEPDNVKDVNIVPVTGLKEEWKVYSSNDNYQKIFTKDMVDALNAFTVNDIMNDLIISFQKERSMVALSYADSLMVIPLEHEFKIDGIEQYKSDINKVVDLVKAINKNKYIKK